MGLWAVNYKYKRQNQDPAFWNTSAFYVQGHHWRKAKVVKLTYQIVLALPPPPHICHHASMTPQLPVLCELDFCLSILWPTNKACVVDAHKKNKIHAHILWLGITSLKSYNTVGRTMDLEEKAVALSLILLQTSTEWFQMLTVLRYNHCRNFLKEHLAQNRYIINALAICFFDK